MSKRPKPTMKQVAAELVRLNIIIEELVRLAHPPCQTEKNSTK